MAHMPRSCCSYTSRACQVESRDWGGGGGRDDVRGMGEWARLKILDSDRGPTPQKRKVWLFTLVSPNGSAQEGFARLHLCKAACPTMDGQTRQKHLRFRLETSSSSPADHCYILLLKISHKLRCATNHVPEAVVHEYECLLLPHTYPVDSQGSH